MVKLSSIKQCNNQIDETTAPRVAVFMGGTSGIGKITLARIAALGYDFTAYVVGRKASQASFKAFSSELQETNPKTKVIWIQGEVSLLAEVKRVCEHITSLEPSIDLLFMTAGYAPLGGRINTSEDLETTHALNFYSRICFVENLLPQLRASGSARVISVHSGGAETTALNTTDLNLEAENAYGFSMYKSQFQMGAMGTLTLERIADAAENKNIVFIHSHPGFVRTGNLYHGWKEGSWGRRVASCTIDPLIWLFQFSFAESAERHLYQVGSGTFGGKGPVVEGLVGVNTRGGTEGGLFLVSYMCDVKRNERTLEVLREKAGDVVWKKVREIVGPYVS